MMCGMTGKVYSCEQFKITSVQKRSNQEEMFHGLRPKFVNCFESVSVYGEKQRPLNCQVIGISTSS